MKNLQKTLCFRLPVSELAVSESPRWNSAHRWISDQAEQVAGDIPRRLALILNIKLLQWLPVCMAYDVALVSNVSPIISAWLHSAKHIQCRVITWGLVLSLLVTLLCLWYVVHLITWINQVWMTQVLCVSRQAFFYYNTGRPFGPVFPVVSTSGIRLLLAN